MKKLLLILFSNTILLAFSFLILEFFFRYQNKNLKSSSIDTSRAIRLKELNPNAIAYFRPSSDYLKYSTSLSDEVYKIETDDYGFIKPSGNLKADIKIIFHGGSTTECLYVSENKRFPFLVQENLKADFPQKTIGTWNSGVSGNNSMHSINTLLNKSLALNPTHVVLMHNMNDLSQLMRYEKSYWQRNDDYMKGRTLIINKNENFSLKKILKKSFFIQKLNYLMKKLSKSSNTKKAKIDENYVKNLSPVLKIKDTKEISNEIFRKYKSQLKTFVAISKAHNVEPILMTQANRLVLNPDPLIIGPEFDKGLTRYGISFKTFIDTYSKLNNIIREVGNEESILVIDLDKKIPKTRNYIYDLFHYNNLGSEKAAGIISNELKRIIEIKINN